MEIGHQLPESSAPMSYVVGRFNAREEHEHKVLLLLLLLFA